MSGPFKVEPSPEGVAMDKLRDIANGQRKHIGIADARAINDLFEGLQFRLRCMVQFYDDHVGTPCAQIRREQERSELLATLEKAAPFVGWASTRAQIIAGVDAGELCDVIDGVIDKTREGLKDADRRPRDVAPDLLAALEYAREALGNPVPVSKRHVARKIDAALAKARGEQS